MEITPPKISYFCEELIERLIDDIKRNSKDEIVAVLVWKRKPQEVYVDYEMMKNGTGRIEAKVTTEKFIKLMTADQLLTLLDQQNSLI